MDYVNLGQSGLKVSRLCLGCMSFGAPDRGNHEWTMGEEDSRKIIRQALEAGINFFDTANAYSDGHSEEILGRALNDMAQRDEVVVATKAFFSWKAAPNTGGLSRKALFAAVDDSLARLGMDHVDLLQIHRFDCSTPVEETMEALHDLVKSGKVGYIGASSMEAWRFAKLQHAAERHGWTRFVSMQNYLNLLYREEEREMIPLCADQGVGLIPWSPMARGRLARPAGEATRRSETDQVMGRLFARTEANDLEVIAAVEAAAASRGAEMAQVALAWVLAKPEVSAPIVGVTKAGHLETAIAALDLELTPEEIERIEAPYAPHPVSGLYPPRPFKGSLTPPA